VTGEGGAPRHRYVSGTSSEAHQHRHRLPSDHIAAATWLATLSACLPAHSAAWLTNASRARLRLPAPPLPAPAATAAACAGGGVHSAPVRDEKGALKKYRVDQFNKEGWRGGSLEGACRCSWGCLTGWLWLFMHGDFSIPACAAVPNPLPHPNCPSSPAHAPCSPHPLIFCCCRLPRLHCVHAHGGPSCAPVVRHLQERQEQGPARLLRAAGPGRDCGHGGWVVGGHRLGRGGAGPRAGSLQLRGLLGLGLGETVATRAEGMLNLDMVPPYQATGLSLA
jgi:hypothetical protein